MGIEIQQRLSIDTQTLGVKPCEGDCARLWISSQRGPWQHMEHFTYAPLDVNQLNQGDVLKRTPELETILREVHPHYTRADYPFFIVLTQSCDLIPRDGGPCASRYVTLAAVRPLRLVLEREVRRFQYSSIDKKLGICNRAQHPKMVQLAERLLNNNQEEYFFLQRKPGSGFEDDHCAFLQLSIALKAELHYETLLAAKILQLSESFQHKLGHLVGTMYSRVGTEDWVPEHATEAEFRSRTCELVEDLVGWLEKDLHQRVLKELRKLQDEQQTPEKLIEVVGQIRKTREAKLKDGLDSIERVLHEAGIEPVLSGKIRRRLESNGNIRSRLSR